MSTHNTHEALRSLQELAARLCICERDHALMMGAPHESDANAQMICDDCGLCMCVHVQVGEDEYACPGDGDLLDRIALAENGDIPPNDHESER